MKKRRLKNDIILTASILAAAFAVFAVFMLTRSRGSYAVVLIDGKETARYSLSTDAEITLDAGGGEYNILVIKNGEAYISDASCRDRICVKHSAIKYCGETITCLPHKTVIRIISPDTGGVDAVS